MYASNTHVIRLATAADAGSLSRLAELTSAPPLTGRVLIAQVQETTVAAIAVDDRRTLADPGRFVGYLLPCLRAQAQALADEAGRRGRHEERHPDRRHMPTHVWSPPRFAGAPTRVPAGAHH